jgi:hypothetical protein
MASYCFDLVRGLSNDTDGAGKGAVDRSGRQVLVEAVSMYALVLILQSKR